VRARHFGPNKRFVCFGGIAHASQSFLGCAHQPGHPVDDGNKYEILCVVWQKVINAGFLRRNELCVCFVYQPEVLITINVLPIRVRIIIVAPQ
jgi:hypothetical protein